MTKLSFSRQCTIPKKSKTPFYSVNDDPLVSNNNQSVSVVQHRFSAAKESLYFHMSQRSINSEGCLRRRPFSCQVCQFLKAAPALCCSKSRQGILFGPAWIHLISCQQGPLSMEWRCEKENRNHHDWQLTDVRLSIRQEREEKQGLCCKYKWSHFAVATCAVILSQNFYLQF